MSHVASDFPRPLSFLTLLHAVSSRIRPVVPRLSARLMGRSPVGGRSGWRPLREVKASEAFTQAAP